MNIKSFLDLYSFYKIKKNSFQTDLELPIYHGISRQDINSLVIHFDLSDGTIGRYLFIGADKFRTGKAYNAKFDLIGLKDKPDIRRCSFVKFIKHYDKSIFDAYVKLYD